MPRSNGNKRRKATVSLSENAYLTIKDQAEKLEMSMSEILRLHIAHSFKANKMKVRKDWPESKRR